MYALVGNGGKGQMVQGMDQTFRTANSKNQSHLWRLLNQTMDPLEQIDNCPFKELFFCLFVFHFITETEALYVQVTCLLGHFSEL